LALLRTYVTSAAVFRTSINISRRVGCTAKDTKLEYANTAYLMYSVRYEVTQDLEH